MDQQFYLKKKKKRPYKVFHRLYIAKGKSVSVPELERMTKPTTVRIVISDLKPKLKDTGLKIDNKSKGFYKLTVI